MFDPKAAKRVLGAVTCRSTGPITCDSQSNDWAYQCDVTCGELCVSTRYTPSSSHVLSNKLSP
jgi:hypothetical protein